MTSEQASEHVLIAFLDKWAAYRLDRTSGKAAMDVYLAYRDLSSQGGQFWIDPRWKALGLGWGDVADMTYAVRAAYMASPDNEADKTVTITISGNRLVSILNTLDSAMRELRDSRPYWHGHESRANVETIRDSLALQRRTLKV